MTHPNTLLGRCTVAMLEEPSNQAAHKTRALFEHLAAEISFLQQCSEISLHDFARLLLDEAAQIPDRYYEPESK